MLNVDGKGREIWSYLRMNGKTFVNYNGKPQLYIAGGSLDGKTDQTIADKYLMKILLIGAKKAVTRKWLQPNTPTLKNWQGTVHEIYIMERLTFALKLQSEKIKRWWSKWIKYIRLRRPELL